MRNAVDLVYEVSLQRAGEEVENIRTYEEDTPQTAYILEAYTDATQEICEPWVSRSKQRRRRCAAYVSKELLRLCRRKKVLYDRMKWRPTSRNKLEYKDACSKTQRRERQLKREHERRVCQRIQNNPNTDIAKALRSSMQKHNRQKALDRATGKQLKPKQFAEYLNTNMLLGEHITLAAKEFTVEKERQMRNVIAAIKAMDKNKAVGMDCAKLWERTAHTWRCLKVTRERQRACLQKFGVQLDTLESSQ